MKPPAIRAALQQHRDIKAELLAQYPELATDDAALADTLEGCSTLDETIAALIREALAREHMADGIGELLKNMQARRARLLAGAEKMREAARWAMEDSGITKLQQPDFTASLGKGSPKVILTAPDQVPDAYVEYERRIKKIEIRNALEDGKVVPGATLGNSPPTLTVRTS